MHSIAYHTFIHENLKQFIEGFRYNAHPMGMLMATVSMSTFYPEASKIGNPENCMLQITRLIAKMPTSERCLSAPTGQAVRLPGQQAVLYANFLAMLFKMSEPTYVATSACAGTGGAVHPARRS